MKESAVTIESESYDSLHTRDVTPCRNYAMQRIVGGEGLDEQLSV